MTEESPRALYARLDARLSPLLRRMLEQHLPRIAGSHWWEICVVSSLTPVQRDNMRAEKTLEQFDYPALVNIVYKNWKSLRHVLGIGNEFTNYLFTLKTFRNDVEHQPDLELSESRRAHLVQAAQLAESLLTARSPKEKGVKGRLWLRLTGAGLLAVLVVGLGVVSARYFAAGADGPLGAEATVCRRLRYQLAYADRFEHLVEVKALFLDETQRLRTFCRAPEEETGALSEEEKTAIEADVRERIQHHLLRARSKTADESVAVRLKKMAAYSSFVKKGLFSAVDFNANYEELTRRIERMQKHYGMPATGTPSDELLGLLEADKVPAELMR